jgi:uncharacterized protein
VGGGEHGVGFSLAEFVLADPLTLVVYDRFENGEHRWHAVGFVGSKLFVVVHSYPDPDDDERVRVIGLRVASTRERILYDKGRFD